MYLYVYILIHVYLSQYMYICIYIYLKTNEVKYMDQPVREATQLIGCKIK